MYPIKNRLPKNIGNQFKIVSILIKSHLQIPVCITHYTILVNPLCIPMRFYLHNSVKQHQNMSNKKPANHMNTWFAGFILIPIR